MIVWDKKKDEWLKEKRGISCEDFTDLIEAGNYLDLIINPSYENQYIFIVRYKNYTYAVPFEFDVEYNIVLKTIYPSRKYHEMYKLIP